MVYEYLINQPGPELTATAIVAITIFCFAATASVIWSLAEAIQNNFRDSMKFLGGAIF